MPIDTHARIAAWLHIALGVLGVCVMLFLGAIFGLFGAAVGAAQTDVPAGLLGWFAGLGLVVFLFFLALPVLEIVGGALLLNGSPVGRVLTIVYSVLGLINVPIGTAIGLYSLWALLRQVPQPATGPVVVPPGSAQPY